MPELRAEGQSLSRVELEEEATRLWRELAPGAVIWLSGDLGSGKTTLAQALARAARAEPARSPTFALVHEYPSPEGVLIHVDCYRLREPAEARDLDFSGLQRRARLLLVEWPGRAGSWAPPPDVWIRLSHENRHDRRWVERLV